MKEYSVRRGVTIIGVTLSCVVVLIGMILLYDLQDKAVYKQAQIDALRGKWKYRMEIRYVKKQNRDTIRDWIYPVVTYYDWDNDTIPRTWYVPVDTVFFKINEQ